MSVSAPSVARGMQGQRAGIVSRFLADAIDLLVIVVAVVGAYFAVSGVRFLLEPGYQRARPRQRLVEIINPEEQQQAVARRWVGSG